MTVLFRFATTAAFLFSQLIVPVSIRSCATVVHAVAAFFFQE
jgi:hypothetical protein